MKTIYKTLLIGMVYLLSNTTYAQIIQYSDDGTKGCIDCEEKNGSIERSCLCSYLFQLRIFNYEISNLNIDYTKERWLYEQELLLAHVITGVNYFLMHTEGFGVPSDYNFENIQREYFKEAETDKLAEEYFTNIANLIKKVKKYDTKALYDATINSRILGIRKAQGTVNTKYGDLKYGDKFLKDMTDNEVNTLLNEQLKIRNDQRSAATEYGIRNSRLQRMLKEGYIANTLAGHLIRHYKSLDYEDAIRFMTRYRIWINSQDQQVPYMVFGNPDNIFTLKDNERQYLLTLTDRTGGTTPPMDGYSPPTFNEMSEEDAIANYAFSTYGDKEFEFMMGAAQNNLRKVTKNYLINNDYSQSSLGWTNNIISDYVHGDLSYNSYDQYVVDGSGTTENTDLDDGAHHVYRWKFNKSGETAGLIALSGFYYSLFNLDTDHYDLEGSILRKMFTATGVNVSDISNYDLGRLYDFSTVYPYGTYKNDIFIDVGLPYIGGSLGFAQEAAIAVINGGNVDFDDEIILDSTVSACMKNVINRLRLKDNHASVNPDITGGGTQHLSSFILDIFDKDPEYGIKFVEKELNTDSNGNEINGKTIKLPNSSTFEISIDDDLSKRGTKLFMAKTIIHESMHAYLLYNNYTAHGSDISIGMNELYKKFREQNPPNTANSLTQHEFMGQYVEALGHSLAAWDFHKQPIDYYVKLSWGGLENSSAYNALEQQEKDTIQRIIRAERYGYNSAKGEKCP